MRFHRKLIGVILIVILLASQGPLMGEEVRRESEKVRPSFQTAQLVPVAEMVPSVSLISLDFKEATVRTVMETLARKARVNIMVSQKVAGNLTFRLENVTWQEALDTITSTYDLGYEKRGNVIVVMTAEELKAKREDAKALIESEPLITKVIQLKYLDAADVARFLEPQLSPEGKISVLEMTGQKGWSFGSGASAGGGGSAQAQVGQRKLRESARSKSIVVTDTISTIHRIEKVLEELDIMPKLILIETRVMEVSRDLLRDLGLEVGTGTGSTSISSTNGFNSTTSARTFTQKFISEKAVTTYGGSTLNQFISPSTFVPAATGLTSANTGLSFLFRYLSTAQLEVLLRTLEEDARTNTLSAPHILTLSGQEAKILVGTKYPILKTDVSGTSTSTTSTSLDYYQDIGIELFVVPQVSGEHHIDMIIHPVVSSRTGTVGTNAYPILDVREAETQVVVEQGDTIVIGGLLKDVKSKSRIGVPFLGKIPILGLVFSRTTVDVAKLDLLIFITARVVDPTTFPSDTQKELMEQYEQFCAQREDKALKEKEPAKETVKKTYKAPAPAAPVIVQKPVVVSQPIPEPVVLKKSVSPVPVTVQKTQVSPTVPIQDSAISNAPAPQKVKSGYSLEEIARIEKDYRDYLRRKKMNRSSTSSRSAIQENYGYIYRKQ